MGLEKNGSCSSERPRMLEAAARCRNYCAGRSDGGKTWPREKCIDLQNGRAGNLDQLVGSPRADHLYDVGLLDGVEIVPPHDGRSCRKAPTT